MRWLRPLALLLALAALTALALSGPGTRFELFTYRTGLTLFRWSAYIGIAAMVAALLAIAVPAARRHGVVMPIVALIIGAVAFAVPFQLQSQARGVPPINDITTDSANPPKYMTTARAYPGAEFARQQREAYPDLAPDGKWSAAMPPPGPSRRSTPPSGSASGTTSRSASPPLTPAVAWTSARSRGSVAATSALMPGGSGPTWSG